MKTIIAIIAVAVAVTVAAACVGIGIARVVHQDDRVAELFIGNVKGVTDQDKALCRSAWKNGGHFMVKSFDVTLTCEKNRIVKEWDPKN